MDAASPSRVPLVITPLLLASAWVPQRLQRGTKLPMPHFFPQFIVLQHSSAWRNSAAVHTKRRFHKIS